MKQTKKLTDSEIMSSLLEKLRYSANSFAKELGLTPSSIYHIVNGKNTISDNLCTRITTKFPEVNFLYLKRGEEPMFINSSLSRTQYNILGDKKTTWSFDSIPKTLKNIENLLTEILEKLD